MKVNNNKIIIYNAVIINNIFTFIQIVNNYIEVFKWITQKLAGKIY